MGLSPALGAVCRRLAKSYAPCVKNGMLDPPVAGNGQLNCKPAWSLNGTGRLDRGEIEQSGRNRRNEDASGQESFTTNLGQHLTGTGALGGSMLKGEKTLQPKGALQEVTESRETRTATLKKGNGTHPQNLGAEVSFRPELGTRTG